jgi:hypothetical protein
VKASLDQFQAAKLVKLCFDLRLVHGLRVLSGVHVFRLTLFACSFVVRGSCVLSMHCIARFHLKISHCFTIGCADLSTEMNTS